MSTNNLTPVGENLATVFGDSMTAYDVGPHFTCTEANIVARALRDLGQSDAAVTFLLGHASEDDEGDAHQSLTRAAATQYVEEV